MNVRVNTEQAFEDEIVSSMQGAGWKLGDQASFRQEYGLDSGQLFTFIGATQQPAFDTLVTYAGGDPDTAQQHFLRFLAKELDTRGALDVLRNGVKDRGVRIHLAYFKPAYTVADDSLDDYRANRLSVTRQLHFSAATPQQSVDLALFVNGVPLATAELKSSASAQPQTVEHAKEQYRADRDPKDVFFARRTLVHFALDEDLVFLSTRLRGEKTLFLPFNQGTSGPGNSGGAGNPGLPAEAEGPSYRTSYLWRQVWQPDAFLDLIKRFLHVEDPRAAKAKGRGSAGKVSQHDRTLIFPRYHQWHAVRDLTAHAARHGSGNNYLIMHSAGSGKSNTIAWLAHRLSTLHGSGTGGALDPAAVAAGRIAPDEPVFHKIVVITDRSVLDKQLQDTIYQFDHTPGVVERITGTGGSKSAEVAAALANTATKIVIVTVQTFPYVLDGVGSLKGKRIAVVVDEAHSGYSSDAVSNVGKVLSGKGSEDVDPDDPLLSSVQARQQLPNVSYFAFTATPKQKTLNKWGVLDPVTKEMRAFHIYAMRQAIEEGFILDVLRNYTTYKTYWRVAKDGAEEIEINPGKAGAQLARLVYLNPATLDAHAEVIVDHFQRNAARRLGGRAKAMVVTRSRESAVRMYHAIVKATDDLGCRHFGTLVAFSGDLEVDGVKVTEATLNGIPEREVPDAFAYTRADNPQSDRTEHRFLVVADKYQTGFDQPLLTSMYVEKPLAGVAAVQTLSRLNRTHPLKSQDDLFVLDFANEADDIQAAFKPYFEEAVAVPADPNLLYTAQRAVMDHQIIVESELQAFVDAYLSAQTAAGAAAGRWDRRHAALYHLTDPARQRFERLAAEDTDAAEMFRSDLTDYIRKYGFLSQVMQFTDVDLERLYLFAKHLVNRLPRRQDPAVDIGEIDLTHLRVARTGQHDMALDPEGAQVLPGFDESGGGVAKDPEKALLSELIDEFNERFGLGLSEADRLQYEERIVAAVEDPDMQEAAVASRNEGDFELPFDSRFRDIMIERAEADTKFTEKFFTDAEFSGRLTREARRAAYRMIRRRHGLSEVA